MSRGSQTQRVVMACAVLLGALGFLMPRAVAQDDPTSTSTPSLLVDGPPAGVGGESGDTPSPTSTSVPADDDDGDGDDTGRLVAMIVGGLVLAALVIAAMTIWYWSRTRPSRRSADEFDDEAPAEDISAAAAIQVESRGDAYVEVAYEDAYEVDWDDDAAWIEPAAASVDGDDHPWRSPDDPVRAGPASHGGANG
ncbi:MAG: hypothetical protein ACRD0G_11250 [Acidimicrobiales bacterium]